MSLKRFDFRADGAGARKGGIAKRLEANQIEVENENSSARYVIPLSLF